METNDIVAENSDKGVMSHFRWENIIGSKRLEMASARNITGWSCC